MSGGKTKAVTPRLRFPEFRHAGPWEVKRLGEVSEILDNMRKPVTSTKRKPGPYPYYGASGAIDYIDEYIFDERLLLIGEDGAKWGPFEKTAFIVEGKYWVNNHAHVLRPVTINDVLLENYLNATDVSVYVTGAAPPKLTLDNLKSIRIPVPLVQEEQKKIANCLSSLDDLICAEASRLEALQAHKKGLMQQLFPREGETNPRLRFPEFRDAGPWEVKRLGEVYRFKPTNSLSRDRLNYDSGSIKNVHYGDIHKGLGIAFRISDEIVPYVNDDVAGTIREDCFCQEGDIIFADASEDVDDIGKAIEIVETGGQRLVAGLHTILASQLDSKIIVGFGAYLFASRVIRKQIQHRAQGAKVLGISKSQIAEVAIGYPRHKREQQKIADCLSSLDDLIRVQGERIETLKQHKKGLMQQLFPQEIA